MSQEETNEFSIMLLCDDKSTKKVESLRAQLPPSPVREDPPHMTLLRGISSSSYRGDSELLADIGPLIRRLFVEKISATVQDMRSINSRLFGPSSVLELDVSEPLRRFRRQIVRVLQAMEYSIENEELDFYHPHVTLALGAPLPTPLPAHLDLFKHNDQINFVGYAINRLVRVELDGKRIARVVSPNPLT